MYAVISQWHGDQALLPEAISITEQELFPILHQSSGFLGFYSVQDPNGITSAIFLWQDKASVDAFLPNAQSFLEHLARLGLQFTSRYAGDVVLSIPQQ